MLLSGNMLIDLLTAKKGKLLLSFLCIFNTFELKISKNKNPLNRPHATSKFPGKIKSVLRIKHLNFRK